EDARLGLHDLAESPERYALAVREAAALPPAHDLGERIDEVAELAQQTSLADAGLSGDRDQLDGFLARRTPVQILEHRQLVPSPDERRAGFPLGLNAEVAARVLRPPQPHGARLALHLDRGELFVVEQVLRQPVGAFADGDA